ncbi:MAG TPA: CDP-diacylglycerol--glycerol-3-phosphate 3-phosphatidyltransferase [Candidatus Limnocylindria bacterium]|nr:CDP-diacylglycerol--glycerol-3-phosphate 3-phosphatidyltransferase [Candidatus Limnocylindria bacterium]
MNLPNKLTVSRFGFTAAFLVAFFSESIPYNETFALVFFCLGGMTDFLDGEIARRRKLITNFGILMDPLADKILVCSAFIAFVEFRLVEAWMVVVIVGRELAITGLRLLAASKNQVLAAESLGKHKTISQITTIISILVMISYQQWGVFGKLFAFEIYDKPWVTWFASITKWFAVALTIFSGAIYLWRNRLVYLDER